MSQDAHASISAPEQALEELRERVQLRDKMGGNLYWNVLNDECCQLANKCLRLGCDTETIDSILGSGTFAR